MASMVITKEICPMTLNVLATWNVPLGKEVQQCAWLLFCVC